MRALRVLVVEDERVVALDLRLSLESLGHEVVALAASGEAAIRLAAQHEPDLVLMDIHLEGAMRGTEAAQRIRALLGTPVVFLTAFAEDDTLTEAIRSAPYGYLLKPFELRELQATMAVALARAESERETESARQRLRLALDAAALGVWEWSEDDQHFRIDERTEALVGGLPQTFVEARDAFLTRIEPADRAAVAELLAHGSPVSRIVAVRDPAGRPLRLELHARHFGGEGRQASRVVGVVQDVTERCLAEARLRQASVVFRTTAEGILILDESRRIVAANEAYCRMSGYSLDEVLGRDPDRVLDIHARSPVPPGTSTRQAHGEVVGRRKSGEFFPAWEHLSTVHDEEERVTHHVLAYTDLSAIRAAEAQVRHMAYHDALTGLGNRHLLEERLAAELSRARRSGHTLALFYADLDGFKTINDTLGHAAGDQLLQVLSARLVQALRRSDLAVRLGGDEFMVVAPEIARAEDCVAMAQKLLLQIAQPVQLGEETVNVTASIGIALFPDNADHAADLIMAADSAMYAAKARGRNGYSYYSNDMARRARERLQIEQGLRRALETDTLELHWQPVVDATRGRPVGLEALLRWTHPEMGVISPVRFIPVAEDCGLIHLLGRWVLRHACGQAQRWRDEGLPPLRIAVNVSVRQFADEGFELAVAQALHDSGLPADALELEITESVLQTPEHSQPILERLKALGVHIAIDDFGTGFSSLALLKHLPIDRIKIDRSFVCDMPGDTNDAAVTRAIVGLARNLGLALTAEGVETLAQRDLLLAMGCDDLQGWFYSRALPAADVPAWLKAWPTA